jgi:L-lysine exporter family protein LysE/ArgO
MNGLSLVDIGVAFSAGFGTGMALIVAIGSQNAFVLRMGLLRSHVLPIVLFCAVSDALLIVAGIGGAGVVVRDNAMWMTAARYGGALFLTSYAVAAALRAWRGGSMPVAATAAASLGRALAACFAFTFLNPHVYLDTMVLLGAIANQYGASERWIFGAGACTASAVWFGALGFGARLLEPVFASVLAWRLLDSVIAAVMLTLAMLLVLR